MSQRRCGTTILSKNYLMMRILYQHHLINCIKNIGQFMTIYGSYGSVPGREKEEKNKMIGSKIIQRRIQRRVRTAGLKRWSLQSKVLKTGGQAQTHSCLGRSLGNQQLLLDEDRAMLYRCHVDIAALFSAIVKSTISRLVNRGVKTSQTQTLFAQRGDRNVDTSCTLTARGCLARRLNQSKPAF